MSDPVNHPSHYRRADDAYEVIKVIEAWRLNFHLGNTVKYIGRPGKGNYLEDLKKARWYLDREIANREREAAREEIRRGRDTFLRRACQPATWWRFRRG